MSCDVTYLHLHEGAKQYVRADSRSKIAAIILSVDSLSLSNLRMRRCSYRVLGRPPITILQIRLVAVRVYVYMSTECVSSSIGVSEH